MSTTSATLLGLDGLAVDIARTERVSYREGLERAILEFREDGAKREPKADHGALDRRAQAIRTERGVGYRQAVLQASEELHVRAVKPWLSRRRGPEVDLDREAQLLMSECASSGQPIGYRQAVLQTSAAAAGQS